MLAGKKQDSAAWWQWVKPQVRKMQSGEGVMIIDDSIEEKPYTDENEIVCWHYDHSKDRLVKGVNFMTFVSHSRDVVAGGVHPDCQDRALGRQEGRQDQA